MRRGARRTRYSLNQSRIWRIPHAYVIVMGEDTPEMKEVDNMFLGTSSSIIELLKLRDKIPPQDKVLQLPWWDIVLSLRNWWYTCFLLLLPHIASKFDWVMKVVGSSVMLADLLPKAERLSAMAVVAPIRARRSPAPPVAKKLRPRFYEDWTRTKDLLLGLLQASKSV